MPGAVLLTEIAVLIRTYVAVPLAIADAVALWVVMTWLHDGLEISTFLNITSATKRCGKSLLLDVISDLVCRSMPTSNVTPAALFRIIEQSAPTLLLDEADQTFAQERCRRSARGDQRLPATGNWPTCCAVWVMIMNRAGLELGAPRCWLALVICRTRFEIVR